MKWLYLSVFLAAPGGVLADTIECDVTRKNRILDVRLGDRIFISHDVKTGVAQISDTINTDRMYGKVARENDKLIAFVWQ